MNSSMINAMVSMNGLQQKLDVLADNIANVNTVGYKKKNATFEDLLNNAKKQTDVFNQPGRLSPMNFNQGWGSRLTTIQPDLTQGPIQNTDKATDIAIEGNGLFEVVANGNRAYTRNGAFQLTLRANGDTILATEEGYPVVANVRDPLTNRVVEGNIVVPHGYSLRIESDGAVSGVSSDLKKTIPLGNIKVLHASRPDALTAVADNLYVVADGIDAGDVVQVIVPGSDNGVSLRQGALEQSNVNLTDEMTELITVQRAYQLAARALSSSDTMMSLANGLRS